MVRPKVPGTLPGSLPGSTEILQGGPRLNAAGGSRIEASASATYRSARSMVKQAPKTDRNQIAKPWQIDVYRHLNICGEARYAATLFSSIAGRAEIGVSEPQTLSGKAKWVDSGIEVDAFAELAPTVRERTKLIRDYMLHRVAAGECYLIARDKVDTDPGYEYAPLDPVWEIVAVTELRKTGTGENAIWSVLHDNGEWLNLRPEDPVIRMWVPDPGNRREAWSPFRSLLPTLAEIEWLTKHIFTQVRSRLLSAGVWFLPDNLTFPPPPPDAVQGGAEAIATMNEAEKFMVSLAASGMEQLDSEEVSFPSVVMADPLALGAVDQKKLIQFWSEIDDKAMVLRSDAVRRFALGMDLPPEQVLGSSGLAVTGAGGSAGSVNHWGVWANEEQTISAHIEPALDDLTAVLTVAFLRVAVEGTEKVIGYDTATLRLRQDRSKESIELFDRGLLSGKIAVRENGFDPTTDMMDPVEHRIWLLTKIAGGSATPEQVQAAMGLLGVDLPVIEPALAGSGGREDQPAPGQPGRNEPRNLDDHTYEGPPRVQNDHSPAPFSAFEAAAEMLVLRALEKSGNRLLNAGVRGKDKDRTTPPHLAHVMNEARETPQFDFSLVSTVYCDLTAAERTKAERRLTELCETLYRDGAPYTRAALLDALRGE